MRNISFHNILSTEFYKLKNNTAKILLLCFPALISLLIAGIMYARFSNITSNPWLIFGSYCFQLYSFLYPLLLSFVVFSFLNIEYQNQGFKQLFTLPVPKLKLYLAKYSAALFYTIISIVIAFVSYFLICNLLGIIRPDLAFQDYTIENQTYIFFFRLLIASVCVCSIQFVLSLIFPNFIIPVSMATVGTIFVMFISRWEYIDYYPYSSIYLATMDWSSSAIDLFPNYMIMTMIYFLVFSVFGYFVFERKSRKV